MAAYAIRNRATSAAGANYCVRCMAAPTAQTLMRTMLLSLETMRSNNVASSEYCRPFEPRTVWHDLPYRSLREWSGGRCDRALLLGNADENGLFSLPRFLFWLVSFGEITSDLVASLRQPNRRKPAPLSRFGRSWTRSLTRGFFLKPILVDEKRLRSAQDKPDLGCDLSFSAPVLELSKTRGRARFQSARRDARPP